MIYLDNAATSWPKPKEVFMAMKKFMEQAGGNPGRSGHRTSVEAARVVYNARECITEFFNAHDPMRVVFTLNVTQAINLVLKGLLKPGDVVLTTSIEHNAVMRPLYALQKIGIKLNVIQCRADSSIDIADVEKGLALRPKLVIINHASNVTGYISPVKEIGKLVRKYNSLLLVDAAQSAGVLSVDMREMNIDILAFTGHKGLLGPTGIGGVIFGERVNVDEIEPIIHGGTGSLSQLYEQPSKLPDKFESGTPNSIGIAGLMASINWIRKRGLDEIRNHEVSLNRILLEGLADIKGIKIFGNKKPDDSTGIVSIRIENRKVSEVGLILDEEYKILCRVGLHCAPSVHHTIGTFPEGTIRLAHSIFTSKKDIEATISAIKAITKNE